MSTNTAYAYIRAHGTPREITVAATHLAYGRTESVVKVYVSVAARTPVTRHLSAVA